MFFFHSLCIMTWNLFAPANLIKCMESIQFQLHCLIHNNRKNEDDFTIFYSTIHRFTIIIRNKLLSQHFLHFFEEEEEKEENESILERFNRPLQITPFWCRKFSFFVIFVRYESTIFVRLFSKLRFEHPQNGKLNAISSKGAGYIEPFLLLIFSPFGVFCLNHCPLLSLRHTSIDLYQHCDRIAFFLFGISNLFAIFFGIWLLGIDQEPKKCRITRMQVQLIWEL